MAFGLLRRPAAPGILWPSLRTFERDAVSLHRHFVPPSQVLAFVSFKASPEGVFRLSLRLRLSELLCTVAFGLFAQGRRFARHIRLGHPQAAALAAFV